MWLAVCGSLNAQKVRHIHEIKTNRPSFASMPYKAGYVFVASQNNFRLIKTINEDDNTRMLGMFYFDTVNRQEQRMRYSFNASLNNGPITFYNHDSHAVLTRNLEQTSKQTRNRLGLYFLAEKNGEWSIQNEFPFNSTDYSCAQACMNRKGDKMIFASDMPGGHGGTDLYITAFENNQWTKPVNLGPAINTSENEMFPFVSESGKLFFSSAKPGGKGGLDVYFCESKGRQYSKPVPLDTLINSAADDFAYWCDSTERRGGFSSARSGHDKIYTFGFSLPVFKECEASEERVLCYEFSEEATADVDSLPLVYEWDFGDGHKVKGLATEHCFEKPGVYKVSLNILDTVIKKLYMNEASYDLEVRDIRQPSMPLPDTLFLKDTLHLTTGAGTFTDFSIMHNYWVIENKIYEEDKKYHVFKSTGIYPVILGITSGQDQKGNYDKKCYVKEIVVTDGTQIPQTVNVNNAVVETNKPQKDTSVNYRVVLDESETRKEINEKNFSYLHSRVKEYYFKEDSLYKYAVGVSSNPVKLKSLYDSVHRAGFVEARVEGMDKHLESTSQYAVSDREFKGISAGQLDSLTGQTFELAVITFDYNKWDIKSEGLPYLDTLVKYLQRHKSCTLEITAHTDSKGPDEFNRNLSQQRAVSVFNYLASKGIEPGRMIKLGYGEKFPKYPNTTEENMMKNRRVEFRILK